MAKHRGQPWFLGPTGPEVGVIEVPQTYLTPGSIMIVTFLPIDR